MTDLWIWLGIIFCLIQSAIFSGMTIGLFGLSLLRLEVEQEMQNKNAIKILSLRKDANFLLSTLLWGNVSINVLIALLSDSVLAGLWAFIFSSFFITIFGEIIPQAFFSRHALKVGHVLVPLVRLYQILLYPIAKPTAIALDAWLGKELIGYFQEHEFKVLLKKHIIAKQSNIDYLEGLGAMNFLTLDDLDIKKEGELIDPNSIISLPMEKGEPIFPKYKKVPQDPFLQKINSSGRKWVIITDPSDKPTFVLDAHKFLRRAIYSAEFQNPYRYCHRPIIVTRSNISLGDVIGKLQVNPEHAEDDVIDHDLILYWTKNKRLIITGADILGRLLRGITKKVYAKKKS